MKYKFVKLLNGWCIEEYDDSSNLVKDTYDDGTVSEYEYNNNNTCIKYIVNGEVVWEKSKLGVLIEELEVYCDEIEYDGITEGFTLTTEDGIKSRIDIIDGEYAMVIFKNKIPNGLPQALKLIKQYYNEENNEN